MPNLRELWDIFPDGIASTPVRVFAGRAQIGPLAAVATSAFAGEAALESRVIRMRAPVGAAINAGTLFRDIATGRVWRVNELAHIGRRYLDVSLSTFVPSASIDPAPSPSALPQPEYNLAFQLSSPTGVPLRDALVYPREWPWASDANIGRSGHAPTLTGTDSDWVWTMPRRDTFFGRPLMMPPRDPVDLARGGDSEGLQASGLITNPILAMVGGDEWYVRFGFGVGTDYQSATIPQVITLWPTNRREIQASLRIMRTDQLDTIAARKRPSMDKATLLAAPVTVLDTSGG